MYFIVYYVWVYVELKHISFVYLKVATICEISKIVTISGLFTVVKHCTEDDIVEAPVQKQFFFIILLELVMGKSFRTGS